MNAFDFQPQTRIVFGNDRVDDLGALAAELGAKRALVVSDPGIVAAGHAAHGIASLEAAGLEATLFEGVHENPTSDDVEAGLVFAQSWGPDLIVGLGGGSSMDCAKGINFLLTSGGRMQDYWGVGKAKQDMLPMIAVPTTSGTGSEAQSFALITDAQTHEKMACGDKRAAFRVAILDPKLTVTQPERVTALTGIDAIAHAIETYVTKKRNPASIAFSREAWRLLGESFGKVLSNGEDLDARSGMQLGACFAGLAIENSMLGAAHALANPLTANYGVVHGQAVGVMLPHVIRFNGQEQEFGVWYRELLEVTEGINGCPAPDSGPEGLALYISRLAGEAGLMLQLSELGVEEAKLEQLAEEAAKQWTGTFNPRTVNSDDLLQIYKAAF